MTGPARSAERRKISSKRPPEPPVAETLIPEDLRRLHLLEKAVENTNEAFVTIDEGHRVIFFNRAAERIFGWDREDVVGRDLTAIMGPGCAQDHRRAVERYVRTRSPRRIGHDTEMTAVRKGGETFPAGISFSVLEQDGKLYFTGIVRDLTETKALQEQVGRSERMAALGRFVAEISHEIKNPLMMIGGFSRQLAGENPDPKTAKKLRIIVEEVTRLESLLAELRDFHLPRALKLEEVDLAELLEEVRSLLAADCERSRIRLEVKADPVTVRADRDRLKQVLLNLAKNALEAMDDGGKLLLGAELSGEEVGLVVADSGCGIPAEDREKVFSPFYTTKRQGTGLGLSVSRRIIEDHPGCRVALSSEEGQGTVFRITMPVVRAAGGKPKPMEEGKQE